MASVSVSLEDPVYHRLDQLAAFGLIPSHMLGQRPWVRTEIARRITEAESHYPEFADRYRKETLTARESTPRLLEKIFVDRILKQLKQQYQEELASAGPTIFRPLQQFDFRYAYVDADFRPVATPTEQGSLDAVPRTLLANREGRHYQDGSNFSFETEHWMQWKDTLALQLQPRFQTQVAAGPAEGENQVYLQRANLHASYRALDLTVGRESVAWGVGGRGGLSFSDNARPLDLVKIASRSPFRFPGAGPTQIALLVANLGPEQNPKNSGLLAYKISNAGIPHLEIGWTQTFLLEGQSEMTSSLEFSGEVPAWRRLKFYGELHWEAFDSWGENLSYLVGAYLPRLNDLGTMHLRFEARRLGERYARQSGERSGFSENRLLLGDPVGPDVVSFQLDWGWELGLKNQIDATLRAVFAPEAVSLEAARESFSGNRYDLLLHWKHFVNPYLLSRVSFGMEKSTFAAMEGEWNWLGEFGVTVYPRKQF